LNEQGFFILLPLSLTFGAGLMLLGTVILARMIGENQNLLYRNRQLQAFYLAQAGAEEGYRWLKQQEALPEDPDPRDDTIPVPLSVGVERATLGAGQYEVRINAVPNLVAGYRIEATGTAAPIRRRIEMVVQFENFARYAIFLGNPLSSSPYFMPNSVIEGPLHANGWLKIFGLNPVVGDPTDDDFPTFLGAVTYTGGLDYYRDVKPDRPVPDVFQDGAQPVAQREIPEDPTEHLLAVADGQTTPLVFEGPTQVTLLPTGSIEVTNAGLTTWHTIQPEGSVLCVKPTSTAPATLSIGGTLRGQLTVCSTGSIQIVDHLRYQRSPVSDSQSKDMLGLVARRNIVIPAGAPNDLEIFGVLLAARGTVYVKDMDSRPPQGTLRIYGGLIEYNTSPFGQFDNNGTLIHGYQGQYQYDQRTQVVSPPHFPVSTSLRVLTWQSD
jgi:hypothetical protein